MGKPLKTTRARGFSSNCNYFLFGYTTSTLSSQKVVAMEFLRSLIGGGNLSPQYKLPPLTGGHTLPPLTGGQVPPKYVFKGYEIPPSFLIGKENMQDDTSFHCYYHWRKSLYSESN